MKRPDSFLTVIVLILALLGGVYYYGVNSMSYFDDPVIHSMVQRRAQLIQVKKKLRDIEQNTAKQNESSVARGLASIPAAQYNAPDAYDFVVESRADAEKMAQRYYQQAQLKCYEAGQEETCLNHIDKIVTHFPESLWAGESLILLTDYYYRTARVEQAREIVAILKDEFSHSSSIQSKVAIIEKVIR